ncbi:MAG: hypothetical protein OXE57_01465 [Alphaproteobacteria bacterium]|nr:hypothetical protein [Alphaproteobacteria bacterium]
MIVGDASEASFVKAAGAQALLAATRIRTAASTDETLFEAAADRSAPVLSVIMARAEGYEYRPQ